MKSASMTVGLVALTLPALANSATGYRYAVLNEIQSSAVGSSSDPAIVHVSQDGSWVGAVDCPATWAYFDAKLNPHFMATILMAGAADRIVRIYVDDALPKFNGHCQVKYVSFEPGS